MAGWLAVRILCIEPIAENLLREPIEYLYADHFRQRCLCTALDEMMAHSDDPSVPACAQAVLTYLKQELPFHVADEEQSLFPLLRKRCEPEDRIDQVIGLLSEEHLRDDAHAEALIAGLQHVAAGTARTSWDAFWHAATAYSEAQRRHLSWENALVLPIARKRLSGADMLMLGHEMARRRGISYPE